MMPEPETLARMIATPCIIAVAVALVAFVGWILHL